MLFAIFAIVLAIGITCSVVYKRVFDDYKHDWLMFIGVILSALAGIAMFVSFIVMGINYIGKDAETAILETRYEMLTYQYENNIYENDNDLGKRELIVNIQEWNETLARNQKLQDDFWVGVYVPDIYDQFAFIDLSGAGVNNVE